ncbi:hypothetical protein [Anaerocolumna xylanovorans]|uniref:Uncharacterized protein n=1 Tax=Anaerocolumna xylanovorans DSM 12503 TaxID=1121345 RepID=A0A1M7Y469_9FIRM|nr:hypothetical protein [Anaerocolumna xylanovorans]SHO47017.1 hypothetical protein SAMN02745217_01367 [Anaerocolumna xylanovorans DSM 12503]
MEVFGKIVAIFAGVVLLFIAPLFYMAQKQDSISQLYVTQETVRLVDGIRAEGEVSRIMYYDYISRIDKTGNLYDIEITHSHRKVAPDYDEVTDTAGDTISSYFYNTYEDEIFEAFDEGKAYHFSQGDYISVKIINRNKTMAQRMLSGVSILITYGGLIRDETD